MRGVCNLTVVFVAHSENIIMDKIICVDKGESQGFLISNCHLRSTCTTCKSCKALNEDKKCTFRQYLGLVQELLLHIQWPDLRRMIG